MSHWPLRLSWSIFHLVWGLGGPSVVLVLLLKGVFLLEDVGRQHLYYKLGFINLVIQFNLD